LRAIQIKINHSVVSSAKANVEEMNSDQRENVKIQHCFDPEQKTCLMELKTKESITFFTTETSMLMLLNTTQFSHSKITFSILDDNEYEELQKRRDNYIVWDFTGQSKTAQLVLSDCDNNGKCAASVAGGAITGGVMGAAAGASGGAVVGGIGAAPGAILGGLLGALGGGLTGAALGCFDGDTDESYDCGGSSGILPHSIR